MALYNLTAISNADNLYQFMTEANVLADGLFGGLIVISLFMILVINFRNYEPKRAFAGASFIVSIVATLLFTLNWLSSTYMYMTFIVSALSLVWLRWSD